MKKKYFNIAFQKMNRYDKKAKNPFLSNNYEYNPFKSIYEQLYIWVEDNSRGHIIDPF